MLDGRGACFYWESRLAPPKYPEVYMTNISDGATQSDYILPKIVQFEVGKKKGRGVLLIRENA